MQSGIGSPMVPGYALGRRLGQPPPGQSYPLNEDKAGATQAAMARQLSALKAAVQLFSENVDDTVALWSRDTTPMATPKISAAGSPRFLTDDEDSADKSKSIEARLALRRAEQERAASEWTANSQAAATKVAATMEAASKVLADRRVDSKQSVRPEDVAKRKEIEAYDKKSREKQPAPSPIGRAATATGKSVKAPEVPKQLASSAVDRAAASIIKAPAVAGPSLAQMIANRLEAKRSAPEISQQQSMNRITKAMDASAQSTPSKRNNGSTQTSATKTLFGRPSTASAPTSPLSGAVSPSSPASFKSPFAPATKPAEASATVPAKRPTSPASGAFSPSSPASLRSPVSVASPSAVAQKATATAGVAPRSPASPFPPGTRPAGASATAPAVRLSPVSAAATPASQTAIPKTRSVERLTANGNNVVAQRPENTSGSIAANARSTMEKDSVRFSEKIAAERESVRKAAERQNVADKVGVDKTFRDKMAAQNIAKEKEVTKKAAADTNRVGKVAADRKVAETIATTSAVGARTVARTAVATKVAAEKTTAAASRKTAADRATQDFKARAAQREEERAAADQQRAAAKESADRENSRQEAVDKARKEAAARAAKREEEERAAAEQQRAMQEAEKTAAAVKEAADKAAFMQEAADRATKEAAARVAKREEEAQQLRAVQEGRAATVAVDSRVAEKPAITRSWEVAQARPASTTSTPSPVARFFPTLAEKAAVQAIFKVPIKEVVVQHVHKERPKPGDAETKAAKVAWAAAQAVLIYVDESLCNGDPHALVACQAAASMELTLAEHSIELARDQIEAAEVEKAGPLVAEADESWWTPILDCLLCQTRVPIVKLHTEYHNSAGFIGCRLASRSAALQAKKALKRAAEQWDGRDIDLECIESYQALAIARLAAAEKAQDVVEKTCYLWANEWAHHH